MPVRLHRQAAQGRLRREDASAARPSVMRQAMFSDDIATKPGLLQRDRPAREVGHRSSGCWSWPRSCAHIPVLARDVRSRRSCSRPSRRALALGFFVKRVWLFIPHLHRASSCCRRRSTSSRTATIVVQLGTWFGHPVGLTRQGLNAAGAHRHAGRGVDLARRAAHAHDAVEPLLAVAARPVRARACSSLVLGMAYRYVFHLLNGVTDMYTARKARTVTRDTDATSRPRVRRRDRRRAVRQGARAVGGGAPWRWWRGATPATPERSTVRGYVRRRVLVGRLRVVRHRGVWVAIVSSVAEPLLVVDGRCDVLATSERFPALDGVSLTVAPGRAGRAARRERLRQVDAAQDPRRAAVPRRRARTRRSASR